MNSLRNFLLQLKNGESANSPLLGVGKYCNGIKPPVQNTSSNYLYVKLSVSYAIVHFKLLFRYGTNYVLYIIIFYFVNQYSCAKQMIPYLRSFQRVRA